MESRGVGEAGVVENDGLDVLMGSQDRTSTTETVHSVPEI